MSKIGSILGIPLKTNRYTKEKSILQFARLLIEMPLDGNFPDFIDFINDNDVLVRQQVKFEWKPIQCAHYHMLGHDISVCKKERKIRQEWRVVQRGPLPEGHEEDQAHEHPVPALDPQHDGFTPVLRRASAKCIINATSSQPSEQDNIYQALFGTEE